MVTKRQLELHLGENLQLASSWQNIAHTAHMVPRSEQHALRPVMPALKPFLPWRLLFRLCGRYPELLPNRLTLFLVNL